MNAARSPASSSLRLRRHDRLQLEITVEHPSPSLLGEAVEGELELWFYLPPAVGIDAESYKPEDFYADLRAFSRLRTPIISLGELCRLDGHGSPLAAMAALAGVQPPSIPHSEQKKIRREARLLACIYRSACRLPFEQARAAASVLPAAAAKHALELARCSARLMSDYRAMVEHLKPFKLQKKTHAALSYCEEFLSLLVERNAVHMLALLQELPAHPDLAAAGEPLRRLARAESDLRRAKGWRSVLGAADERVDAAFLDQASLLKKYVSSELFLTLRRSRARDWAQHAILGVAAALAMAWAIGVQVFMLFALGLELNQGTSGALLGLFASLAVFGYILKDRMKAAVAGALSERLPDWLDDRRHHLVLPRSETRLGTIFEVMRFLSPKEVPEPVRRTRVSAARTALLREADAAVLHYRRKVRFSPREALAEFPRFDGLKDILRLNVWRWIRTLADPRKVVVILDDAGELRTRRAPHRYVVDVLARYSVATPEGARQSRITLARLTLNRRGIVQVEALRGDEQPAAKPEAPSQASRRAAASPAAE